MLIEKYILKVRFPFDKMRLLIKYLYTPPKNFVIAKWSCHKSSSTSRRRIFRIRHKILHRVPGSHRTWSPSSRPSSARTTMRGGQHQVGLIVGLVFVVIVFLHCIIIIWTIIGIPSPKCPWMCGGAAGKVNRWHFFARATSLQPMILSPVHFTLQTNPDTPLICKNAP